MELKVFVLTPPTRLDNRAPRDPLGQAKPPNGIDLQGSRRLTKSHLTASASRRNLPIYTGLDESLLIQAHTGFVGISEKREAADSKVRVEDGKRGRSATCPARQPIFTVKAKGLSGWVMILCGERNAWPRALVDISNVCNAKTPRLNAKKQRSTSSRVTGEIALVVPSSGTHLSLLFCLPVGYHGLFITICLDQVLPRLVIERENGLVLAYIVTTLFF